MFPKRFKVLSVAVGVTALGFGTFAVTNGSATAATPKVANGCWIDVIADFENPDASPASSPEAAVAAEATTGGKGGATARIALGVVDTAQLDVLKRMKPSTPAQQSTVARSLGAPASSEENVWVSQRSDGTIDGSLVVSHVEQGGYAVSEKHFALPASVDCNRNQLN